MKRWAAVCSTGKHYYFFKRYAQRRADELNARMQGVLTYTVERV